MVVIPLTRVFRKRGDSYFTIVNEIAAKTMNWSFLFGVEQMLPRGYNFCVVDVKSICASQNFCK